MPWTWTARECRTGFWEIIWPLWPWGRRRYYTFRWHWKVPHVPGPLKRKDLGYDFSCILQEEYGMCPGRQGKWCLLCSFIRKEHQEYNHHELQASWGKEQYVLCASGQSTLSLRTIWKLYLQRQVVELLVLKDKYIFQTLYHLSACLILPVHRQRVPF